MINIVDCAICKYAYLSNLIKKNRGGNKNHIIYHKILLRLFAKDHMRE